MTTSSEVREAYDWHKTNSGGVVGRRAMGALESARIEVWIRDLIDAEEYRLRVEYEECVMDGPAEWGWCDNMNDRERQHFLEAYYDKYRCFYVRLERREVCSKGHEHWEHVDSIGGVWIEGADDDHIQRDILVQLAWDEYTRIEM